MVKAEAFAARRLMIRELNRAMVRGIRAYCAICRKPEATSAMQAEGKYVSSVVELRKSSIAVVLPC